MSYQDDVAISKEKMLQTTRALEDYLRGQVYDPDYGRRLINAAALARNEYIDRLAHLCRPEQSEFKDLPQGTAVEFQPNLSH